MATQTSKLQKDHDANKKTFLKWCEERHAQLKGEKKIQLWLPEVPFIGHVATAQSVQMDPHKVQTEDVAAVRRLLWLMQYLSKFMPHLSDVAKPLRELTQKEVVQTWGPAQKKASEEVTVQCDASQYGLGAALLQKGQPLTYASRALTDPETRYAQIEKELLSTVFACEHFVYYLYGQEIVNVETDHQPLESNVLKPLHKAPSCLQRMILRLQKFSLRVKYKKGKNMFLTDTLRRDYLSDVSSSTPSKKWTTPRLWLFQKANYKS